MRKKLSAILLVTACTMLFPITAQAGKWEQNDIGWWYDHQDGTWAANGWEWIDGRCYYFNEEGYCYMNPTAPTPDGYFVDASGAWVVDGVVQTQTEVVNAGNQSEDKTAELQAPFLGKWVRVAEYNTAGMYPSTGEKQLVPGREDSFERLQEMAVQFIDADNSVEEKIIQKLEQEQLHKAIMELSREEKWLIQELYFEERTERDVAAELGLSQKVVNKRRQKILEKLRKLF